MYLEDGIRAYIKAQLEEKEVSLPEEEIERLVANITCDVADTIDQEMNHL